MSEWRVIEGGRAGGKDGGRQAGGEGGRGVLLCFIRTDVDVV